MIYSNGSTVALALPEGAPRLMRPLIQASDDELTPGTRKYVVADFSVPNTELFVTLLGHWYRMGECRDADADGNWVCRGCGAVGETGTRMDRLNGRCPRPPEGQDVATALLGSAQRPAPARMRSRRIRFVRSEVTA